MSRSGLVSDENLHGETPGCRSETTETDALCGDAAQYECLI